MVTATANRTSAHEPVLTWSRSVGGPVPRAWREGTLTRAKELESLAAWVTRVHPRDHSEDLTSAIAQHLHAARQAAHPHRRWRFSDKALVERAMSNLDAAEAQLLNLAPPEYVLGQMPSLLNDVQRHLLPADPRRQELERIAAEVGVRDPAHPLLHRPQPDVDGKLRTVRDERGKIVTAVRGASSAALREQLRVRSFRGVLVATTVLMTLLAVGVALLGVFSPATIPLCFQPEKDNRTGVVCPTQQSVLPTPGPQAGPVAPDVDDEVRKTVTTRDLLVVELLGVAAASVAAAAAIRGIRGSSEPHGLPVAVAVLKLPTGAITAFLGLLLMRGQFIPGLSALDTSAQILAWAVVFGYAQQLFTRLVDQQAHTVLDSVRGADKRDKALPASV